MEANSAVICFLGTLIVTENNARTICIALRQSYRKLESVGRRFKEFCRAVYVVDVKGHALLSRRFLNVGLLSIISSGSITVTRKIGDLSRHFLFGLKPHKKIIICFSYSRVVCLDLIGSSDIGINCDLFNLAFEIICITGSVVTANTHTPELLCGSVISVFLHSYRARLIKLAVDIAADLSRRLVTNDRNVYPFACIDRRILKDVLNRIAILLLIIKLYRRVTLYLNTNRIISLFFVVAVNYACTLCVALGESYDKFKSIRLLLEEFCRLKKLIRRESHTCVVRSSSKERKRNH